MHDACMYMWIVSYSGFDISFDMKIDWVAARVVEYLRACAVVGVSFFSIIFCS
ncbi:hypothetical protein BDV29DRAFT_176428 [Aspergillus leporis]|jgi:hypothetical protein|uniref:Uncharacterized protein n=1 Tax=Aspergillus leporis TaxID=41062 RepID=A0A5N5WWL6_9EURO|nr:hypothetical protein BDV29DRAFT_176428 [Aspergillus leporis]